MGWYSSHLPSVRLKPNPFGLGVRPRTCSARPRGASALKRARATGRPRPRLRAILRRLLVNLGSDAPAGESDRRRQTPIPPPITTTLGPIPASVPAGEPDGKGAALAAWGRLAPRSWP